MKRTQLTILILFLALYIFVVPKIYYIINGDEEVQLVASENLVNNSFLGNYSIEEGKIISTPLTKHPPINSLVNAGFMSLGLNDHFSISIVKFIFLLTNWITLFILLKKFNLSNLNYFTYLIFIGVYTLSNLNSGAIHIGRALFPIVVIMLLNYKENQKVRYALWAAFVTTIMIFVRYQNIFLIPVIFIWLYLSKYKNITKIKAFISSSSFTLIPIGTFVLIRLAFMINYGADRWSNPLAGTIFWIPNLHIRVLQAMFIGNFGLHRIGNKIISFGGFWTQFYFAILLIIPFFLIWLYRKSKNIKINIYNHLIIIYFICLASLFIILLFTSYFLESHPYAWVVHKIKYWAVLFPLFVLIILKGIEYINSIWIKKIVAIFIIMLSISYCTFYVYTSTKKADHFRTLQIRARGLINTKMNQVKTKNIIVTSNTQHFCLSNCVSTKLSSSNTQLLYAEVVVNPFRGYNYSSWDEFDYPTGLNYKTKSENLSAKEKMKINNDLIINFQIVSYK